MASVSSDRQGFKFHLFLKSLVYGFVTEYETPKIVMIHSYTITILLRFLQIILLMYSIGYLLIYEKGYQKQDSSIISSITLKVKGIGYIYTSDNNSYIVDGSDYIVPPSENNAIFIMTNFIPTDQSRTSCSESSALKEAVCMSDKHCRARPYLPSANGRWTGRCLFPSNNLNQPRPMKGLCEIQGWCPVENDSQNPVIIQEILSFTIFIKNFIEFPVFNVKHKNMVENLKSCVFDPRKYPDCPIFRLSYILEQSESNATERDLMLRFGAVIRVKIDWDCNLDRSIKTCKPIYSFARLDTPFHEESFSPGFNFRFASHWKDKKEYLRSLKKAFGLRLVISVSGKAGKFDFITLTLNTGSIVGIFGLATFFCDLILLNLTKKAAVYRDYVIQRAAEEAADRRVSTVTNTRMQREPMEINLTNRYADDYHRLQSLQTAASLVKLTDTVIDPKELFKYQSSIGVTNAIH